MLYEVALILEHGREVVGLGYQRVRWSGVGGIEFPAAEEDWGCIEGCVVFRLGSIVPKHVFYYDNVWISNGNTVIVTNAEEEILRSYVGSSASTDVAENLEAALRSNLEEDDGV